MILYAAGVWPEETIQYPKRLYSFGNGGPWIWRLIDRLLTAVKEKPRVLIDSGAFTVWNSGGKIDLQEYIEFISETKRHYASRLRSLNFITLDVIGDTEGTRRNHERIARIHPDVLPVVTRGGTEDDAHWAFSMNDYIAVGGLVKTGAIHQNMVFKVAIQKWRETGEMPRVHLLGVSNLGVLLKYPAYSSDSTSYVAPRRFGRGLWTGGGIPRSTQFGERAKEIQNAEIRHYLRLFKKMERDHERVWCTRGICWEK